MFQKEDFKVELINPEEVKDFVRRHGETAAICYNTNPKYANAVGKSVLETSHFSGSRGDYFKFKFTNVPRALVDQSVRHDVGTFKNVQSQRYVNQTDFNMYFPKEILNDDELLDLWNNYELYTRAVYNRTIDRLGEKYNYTGEKASEIARGVLPMNVESSFVQGFTLEALMNYMNKRLCTCAQEHIRYVADLMREEVLKVAPIYEPYLVPICERQLWCPETKKRSCGRKPVKEELQNLIQLGKDCCKNHKELENDITSGSIH